MKFIKGKIKDEKEISLKKKILLNMLGIIIVIVMTHSCIAQSKCKKELIFEYNGQNYSIDIERIAEENSIRIEEYQY